MSPLATGWQGDCPADPELQSPGLTGLGFVFTQGSVQGPGSASLRMLANQTGMPAPAQSVESPALGDMFTDIPSLFNIFLLVWKQRPFLMF